MTQRQQQIIEDYLFDVFVKLQGNTEKNENWWNNVFLLEAITNMGQHTYRIATFCHPNIFFKHEDEEEEEDNEGNEDNQTDDTDNDSTYNDFTIEKRHEYVDNYLANYYQNENYSDYLLGMATTIAQRGGGESVLQQQYLYIYTIENSEYFMNKFIHGDDIILK